MSLELKELWEGVAGLVEERQAALLCASSVDDWRISGRLRGN